MLFAELFNRARDVHGNCGTEFERVHLRLRTEQPFQDILDGGSANFSGVLRYLSFVDFCVELLKTGRKTS